MHAYCDANVRIQLKAKIGQFTNKDDGYWMMSHPLHGRQFQKLPAEKIRKAVLCCTLLEVRGIIRYI